MQLVNRFVIYRSEKHLERYRDGARNADREFLAQYRSYLPHIQRCYAEAGFWHGTGRYHYIRTNDTRYEQNGTERLVDVLTSIALNGGLVGHEDLWITPDGAPRKTVSLAPHRMYSRLFAHLHLREGVWLKFVYGGTRFWTGLIAFLSIRELLRNAEWSFMRKTLADPKFIRHARTWASAIRDLTPYKRVLPVWRAYDLRSDIDGNYGMLFGIKREAVQSDDTLPCLKNFEIRTPGSVSIADMTHVEVPLEHVEETVKLLSEQGIALPVIPLEFGELYCSQFPLTKLIHV